MSESRICESENMSETAADSQKYWRFDEHAEVAW